MRYEWLIPKEEGMEAIELGLCGARVIKMVSLSVSLALDLPLEQAKAQFFDPTLHSLFEFTDEIYFGRYSI